MLSPQEDLRSKAPPELLRKQIALFQEDSFLKTCLEFIPTSFCILNEQRQMIFANSALLALAELEHTDQCYGKRIGEILGCQIAVSPGHQCGSEEQCAFCGFFSSIERSFHQTQRQTRPVRLIRHYPLSALQLRVWSHVSEFREHRLLLVSIADISAVQRRESLERSFFHDVRNCAGNISTIFELLSDNDSNDQEELLQIGLSASSQLNEEINFHHDLLRAEQGVLHVQLSPISVKKVYNKAIASQRMQSPVRIKDIVLNTHHSEDLTVFTDATALQRIFQTMIQNAFEASKSGDRIEVQWFEQDETVIIEITNPQQLTASQKRNMFIPNFSTKDSGRGLGAYAMKLIAEKYLFAKVWFSVSESGTSFFLSLPAQPVNSLTNKMGLF